MTKLDKETLADIESWRAQLLILFDGDCVDGVEEFSRIYKEVYKFAEEKIIPVVPSQLPRMKKVLKDSGLTLETLEESIECQKKSIAATVALDDILDNWFHTIRKKGLPTVDSEKIDA